MKRLEDGRVIKCCIECTRRKFRGNNSEDSTLIHFECWHPSQLSKEGLPMVLTYRSENSQEWILADCPLPDAETINPKETDSTLIEADAEDKDE